MSIQFETDGGVVSCLQLAACVDMSVELSDAALNFIRNAIESAAAKAQVGQCPTQWCIRMSADCFVLMVAPETTSTKWCITSKCTCPCNRTQQRRTCWRSWKQRKRRSSARRARRPSGARARLPPAAAPPTPRPRCRHQSCCPPACASMRCEIWKCIYLSRAQALTSSANALRCVQIGDVSIGPAQCWLPVDLLVQAGGCTSGTCMCCHRTVASILSQHHAANCVLFTIAAPCVLLWSEASDAASLLMPSELCCCRRATAPWSLLRAATSAARSPRSRTPPRRLLSPPSQRRSERQHSSRARQPPSSSSRSSRTSRQQASRRSRSLHSHSNLQSRQPRQRPRRRSGLSSGSPSSRRLRRRQQQLTAATGSRRESLRQRSSRRPMALHSSRSHCPLTAPILRYAFPAGAVKHRRKSRFQAM